MRAVICLKQSTVQTSSSASDTKNSQRHSRPFRRLCWFSCACSAGIFAAVYLLPEQFCFPAGFLCALVCLGFLRFFKLPRPALVAFGLAVGLLWTGFYGMLFRTPAHTLISEEKLPYTLMVMEFPRETQYGGAVTAKLQTGTATEPTVCLYAGQEVLELRPGDLISANLRLSRSDLRHGENYDYYQSKGIYLLGSVSGQVSLLRRPSAIPIRFWPQWLAQTVKETVSALFPSDVSGFVTSLLTGDKTPLPDGLYAAFRRSGIAHVVAVSGLHLSFLAGLIALLLGKQSKISAAAIIPLLFLFSAATGNSPSALRAAFMTSALLIAPLFGRENDKPTTLSVVLMLLLLFCPYSAASVSLQLSFSAVAGIFLISMPLQHRWIKKLPKWENFPGNLLWHVLRFLIGTLATTLGALLFSTPLSAIHFQSVSLVGPLTNLLTLWAVSATFLSSLFAALAGIISATAGSFLAWFVAWPARWVIFAAQKISLWPFASLSLFSGYTVACFLTVYALLLLWLLARGKVRPAFPIVALVVPIFAAQIIPTYQATQAALTILALDVGQGNATLLLSDGHAVLVDCGGNEGNAGDLAADHIQAHGLSSLDTLILTHYDSDHTNGVTELLARLPVTRMVLSDEGSDTQACTEILTLAQRYGCDVDLLYREDLTLSCGSAEVTVMIPMGAGSSNEAGLSVLCSSGEFDVLITGDMSAKMEERLLKYRQLPDIELLVVGHHGANTSTSSELLRAVQPEYAVISVGYNSYGHPSDETLLRLHLAGCHIYRTDWMGTVTFTVPQTPS